MCNMDQMMAESKSSRALDTLLEEGGEVAERVKQSIERTTLWRYRNGKAMPPADSAAELERLTDGEVPANGWEALPVRRRAS